MEGCFKMSTKIKVDPTSLLTGIKNAFKVIDLQIQLKKEPPKAIQYKIGKINGCNILRVVEPPLTSATEMFRISECNPSYPESIIAE